MLVTGIEVIRDNPGSFVDVAPGGKLALTYGDKLRIATSLKYRGSARGVTLYGSIGNKGAFGFDEVISSESPISLPETPTDFTPVQASVDIPITADIAPDKTYSIYCKIREYVSEAGRPEVDNVIDIVGMPPTFELLEETIYPYAYVFDGPCDVSTFTFKTDPFTPASWISGKLAAAVEQKVKEAGGRVMEMRVYVDKSPLLWTDWRIEVVGTPAPTTAGLGMSVGITWWTVAILAALAIILIIVITWAIKTVVSTFTHKPISEEVKAAWSGETLISAIGDFEGKLERTPTPAEDLEKKSDQELRDYCNELASAVVPPAAGAGLAIAIIGAGILGLGALGIVAYAMAAPKETRK